MAKIRHIVFHTTDVERLAKFYVDVMGLKIVHRAKNGGISLTDGYINLSIHTNKMDGKPSGFNHFGFVVDDNEAIVERCEELGYRRAASATGRPPLCGIPGDRSGRQQFRHFGERLRGDAPRRRQGRGAVAGGDESATPDGAARGEDAMTHETPRGGAGRRARCRLWRCRPRYRRRRRQAWPQRPVRFIVTLGPGSGVDIGARLVADRLPARWGKPVVVENRPGADGLVAIQAFVNAADDHTLLFTPAGSFTVHPLQYSKLPYVPEDLVPIARVSNTILAIAVPTSLNIGSLAEFVKYARAEPGKLNAAVVSGITEFTFDYFVKTAGLSIAKVPYRDIVQAATDLSEGRLQVMMSSYAILQPLVQAGRVQGAGGERP